jgi:hypothetical protein
MTQVWGPMGWMTLHSISVCYPESPTASQKQMLSDFMTAFAFTITCINCRRDFQQMFHTYKTTVPSWSNSKRDLFLAICRMHNTVNKKLDKPTPNTVAECLATLKNAVSYVKQSEFRSKYFDYLYKDWAFYGRGSSLQVAAFHYIELMKKINAEFWSKHEVKYESLKFAEADVLTYPNQRVSEKIVFAKPNLRNIRWSP